MKHCTGSTSYLLLICNKSVTTSFMSSHWIYFSWIFPVKILLFPKIYHIYTLTIRTVFCLKYVNFILYCSLTSDKTTKCTQPLEHILPTPSKANKQIDRQTETDKQRQTDRDRFTKTDRENSNNLVFVNCILFHLEVLSLKLFSLSSTLPFRCSFPAASLTL